MKTKSEALLEEFLTQNKLPFVKIKEEHTPRPDYLVSIGESQLVFEVKELAEDENFGVVKDPTRRYMKSYTRIVAITFGAESNRRESKFNIQRAKAFPRRCLSIIASTWCFSRSAPKQWISSPQCMGSTR